MKGKKEITEEVKMGIETKRMGIKEALMYALSGRERKLERLEELRSLFYIPVAYGFGSGGCRALAGIEMPTGLPYRPVKIAVNNCWADLLRVSEGVDLAVPCGTGKGSSMEPEVGRQDIMGVRDMLPEAVTAVSEFFGVKQGPDLIITISSFGYGFGTGSTLPALNKLRDKFPDVLIIPFIITPFRLEGYKAMERAANELEAIVERFTPVIISNETVSQRYNINARRDDDMTVYNQINRKIQEVVNVLVGSLTTEEGYATSTLDRSDLQRIFGKGDAVATLTHATFPSLDNFNLEFIKRAERLEWFETERAGRDADRRPLASTFIVDGGGAFSLGQRREVYEYLFKEYLVDTGTLKPLIIKRERERADFLLIKVGYKLKFERGIISGVY